MITLRNVSKSYHTKGARKWILKAANIHFPQGRSVALLGRNGAGKSTLLKMISGSIDYDSGEITHSGTISWPIGFAGSFHPELTGAQNTRFLARVYGVDTDGLSLGMPRPVWFLARVYGVDTDELVAFAKNFAELGDFFNMPFRTYSAGMRSRLAFGISMGVSFDTYLVDEVTSVGDAVFREKCDAVLGQRMKNSSAIVVSHTMETVRKLCDCGVVMDQGTITYYENIDQAIHHHNLIMMNRSS